VGGAFSPIAEVRWYDPGTVGSGQRLENWHLLLLW